MSTGVVPPQNPGTEALLWAVAVALFHYKPSHTTLPSPPPASSKAPLPSIWDLESSSEPGTATFGCVPTVCVCVCVFLQSPCNSLLCNCSSHTRRRYPKHRLRTQSGVRCARRLQNSLLSLHRHLHHPGGAESCTVHVPLPPADVPIPRLH